MNEMVRQILVGVVIAAIAGVWVFASTRASIASVDDVRLGVKELEVELKDDIDKISINIDEIKDNFHRSAIKQTKFRTQVREKLNIDE